MTSEPSGSSPPEPDGHRFVVQRHRASQLHYDLRLEAAGVLISWAVPKGPTLDPSAKRLAMHVEDHPLDYYDFEGVIPAAEYGGDDVIVWDWGTWDLAKGDDPIEAVEAGDLHFDLHGQKLNGRFALVRRGPPSQREQWMLIHKHDEFAVEKWDPEDHPRSVRSGRTNDEVKAAPAASWSGSSIWRAPTADELAALDALKNKGGEWTLGEHTLKLTNLDKVLFPGRGRRAITKRDLIRHNAAMARVFGARLAGGAGMGGELRRDRAPPVDVDHRPPHQPTWAMIDIDPGAKSTFADVVVLARLHRTALEHIGVQTCAKLTGQRGIQIWVPVADGYTFDQTRAWVERLSRVIGETVPEMISWEWEIAKRKGRMRLDYTQNAINKTLVAPFSTRPIPGAPVSVPIAWDELDDPDLRPDRWTVSNVGERLQQAGDPLAPLIGAQQKLPTI